LKIIEVLLILGVDLEIVDCPSISYNQNFHNEKVKYSEFLLN